MARRIGEVTGRGAAGVVAWWVLFLLSVGVAGYAASYLVLGERVFPEALADSFRARPWGIFPHAFFGMVALLVAPFQFHPAVQRRVGVHRTIGKVYVVAAFLAGAFGFYMAAYAHGGWVTQSGFGALGVAMMGTTAVAFVRIRQRDYRRHREWMIRSLAMILAAVTLRLWLPLLVTLHGGVFTPAYQMVAWLCWAPNLVVAEWYIRRVRGRPLRFGGAELPSTPSTPASAPPAPTRRPAPRPG